MFQHPVSPSRRQSLLSARPGYCNQTPASCKLLIIVIRSDCPNRGTHRTRSPLVAESPGIATGEKPPPREFGIPGEECQVNGFACCCEEYGLARRACGQEKGRNHYLLRLMNTRTTSNSVSRAELSWAVFRLIASARACSTSR